MTAALPCRPGARLSPGHAAAGAPRDLARMAAQGRRSRIEAVIAAAARVGDVCAKDLHGPRPPMMHPVVAARRAAYVAAIRNGLCSRAELARIMRVHHTSIIHGLRMAAGDAALAGTVARIEAMVGLGRSS